MMLGGYEVLVAALGGLLVGAIAMLWALTRGDSMDTTGIFDKLFSLLQALLMIRATVGANNYSPAPTKEDTAWAKDLGLRKQTQYRGSACARSR